MNVYQRIHAVMLDVSGVQETGKVAHGRTNYSYASDTDLITALRPAMLEHGLVMVPVKVEPALDLDKVGSQETMSRVVLVQTFRVQNIDEPDDFVDVQVLGEGADTLDKAVYKAHTGALKYALRLVFTLPTGDDPDQFASSQQEQAPTQKKRKRSAPSANNAPVAPQVDRAKLEKALGYTVPEGLNIPMENMSFGEVQKDGLTGVYTLLWLAGRVPNHDGVVFEPDTEDLKKVSGAAQYVVAHSDIFQEHLPQFKAANPELLQ